MQIIDNKGMPIQVTDLELAIIQADDYRHYRVSQPSKHHLSLYDYWEDVYQKLIVLRDQPNVSK